MKTYNALSLFNLFLITCLLISCKTNTAFQDFEQDPNFPAFNKELIFEIDGHKIAGYAMIANGKEPKETIILVHGYPGNDNNFDIANAIRRSGKNVIHFNYRGAWGNEGTYLYSNGLKDIDGVIAYLSQADIAKALKIQTDNFTLLGRSYGGGVALIQGSLNDQVRKIIAISSVNYGAIMERYETLADLGGFRRYMEKQFMIDTDIDLFLQEMLDNKKAFNITNYKEQLKSKKVLIIEDTDKNDDWINVLEGVAVKKMDTDHGFIDKRIELTTLIIDWLKK